MVLAATSLVGLGSSVFHPESSRMARAASGGRHGFAQSFFQVGGNFGSALGPLLAAFIVLPLGQSSIAWFSLAALVAMAFLVRVGSWYKGSGAMHAARRASASRRDAVSSRQVVTALADSARACSSRNSFIWRASAATTRSISSAASALSPERADSPVRVSRCGRGGHDHRWTGRRPDRPPPGDSRVDPRRAAVHARAAVRKLVLDAHPHGDHRHGPRFGVLGNCRLCAGADARPRRDDLRDSFSAWRSASAASPRPRLVRSPIARTSSLSIASVRSCRR